MKPLDITKPVQTQDGNPVRILCTDAQMPWPVIGLATEKVLNGRVTSGDRVWRWNLHGRSYRETEDGGDNLVNIRTKVKRWRVTFGDGSFKDYHTLDGACDAHGIGKSGNGYLNDILVSVSKVELYEDELP